MKFSIFVATHKKFEFPLPDNYIPILVGSYKSDLSIYQRDDDGEFQISYKNKNYCELTGLYWIWKNIRTDYVGLCHYRRYFINRKNALVDERDIKMDLSRYDIILPKKYYYLQNNYSNYKKRHHIKDLDLCRDIIEEICPEYIRSFDRVMGRNFLYLYNMFICKKELIDEYCNWLFSIFDVLETKIDLENYDDYQSRVYGFLSERLFNVWIDHKQLKIKEDVVMKIDAKKSEVFVAKIKNEIKKYSYILKWH